MDDDSLIEKLEQGVKEAEELLRRRKEALHALRGRPGAAKNGKRVRGLRADSIPAMAQGAIKAAKQSLSLDELLVQVKKNHPTVDLDSRKLSLALSRYVRIGQYFVFSEGKYGLN